MQKKFRRLAAAILCLTLLAVPALAAEATIDLDYVTIVGEGFVADTFCGVDALYNETGATLFCNELIERFYSAVYGVDVYTDNGNITAASPAGYRFEVTYTPQPGDIAYASAEARERYGNHYAIVKSIDEANGTVTLFEQNWVWDGKAGVNRRISYDGGCYTFYTMCSDAGRAAPAGEAESVSAQPVTGDPQPAYDASTIYAWGSGISSITGTPSNWAAELTARADAYGITMLADGKMEPGDLVVMSGNNTVKKAAAGKFVGVAHAVRGDYVLVQTGGFAVLPYSGTAPTVGFATLAADSNADATASASGREVLVTEVDATAKTVGVLF